MEKETTETSNNTMYYVLGGLVLLGVLVGGYFYLPKTPPVTSPEVTNVNPPVPTAVPGPITKLACDTQYYNPVIGFEKYYLTVEGGDTEGASEVTCTTSVTQENKIVATENTTVPLTAKPERGGLVFKCSTQSLVLKSTIPTKVSIALVDDQGSKATCSALFALPKP